MPSHLVWLITGTTSGLGRDLALEALKRGEKVIATGRARSIDKLEELKAKGADILELDVTAPLEALQDVAKQAIAIHGKIVWNPGAPSSPERIPNMPNTSGMFGRLSIIESRLLAPPIM